MLLSDRYHSSYLELRLTIVGVYQESEFQFIFHPQNYFLPIWACKILLTLKCQLSKNYKNYLYTNSQFLFPIWHRKAFPVLKFTNFTGYSPKWIFYGLPMMFFSCLFCVYVDAWVYVFVCVCVCVCVHAHAHVTVFICFVLVLRQDITHTI